MASRIVQYFADKLKSMKEYPITLTKAVYDENGNRLDDKLSEIDNNITGLNSSLSEKVSGFTSDTYEAVTGLAYDATSNKIGLKVGADTVIPFKSGEIIKIASGLSGANSNNVDCTNISGYQNLTNANFFAKATGSTGFHTENSFGGASMSYNSSTGILTVGTFGVQIGGYCSVYIYDVYCCTGEIK